MAIKSLNEMYNGNSFYYMCNGCGDINNPADDDMSKYWDPEEVLTQKEKDLYDNYWDEGSGCCIYVLRIEDKDFMSLHDDAAMGLGYLFDTEWCKDLAIEHQLIHAQSVMVGFEKDPSWMEKLYTAIEQVAKKIEPMLPGCNIYLGKNTDPDGHEILITIPYEMRDQIKNINAQLNDVTLPIYEWVEEAFLGRPKFVQPPASEPEPTPVSIHTQELELNDDQIARNDEIYNAAFELYKVLVEDADAEWDMRYIGNMVDATVDVLVSMGKRIRYPAVVTETNGTQHIEEYYE